MDADIQRENGVTENASFNGLEETSEDVKMTADETSPRKSKVCTCIYIYGSASRGIYSYIEFFGSDLLTTILGKLNGLNTPDIPFNNITTCIDIFLHVLFCRSPKKRRRRNQRRKTYDIFILLLMNDL